MKLVLRLARKILRQARMIRKQKRELRSYGKYFMDMQTKACERAEFFNKLLGVATPRGGE